MVLALREISCLLLCESIFSTLLCIVKRNVIIMTGVLTEIYPGYSWFIKDKWSACCGEFRKTFPAVVTQVYVGRRIEVLCYFADLNMGHAFILSSNTAEVSALKRWFL